MKVVISIGGSLLTRELTSENFKKYIDVLLKLKERGHRLIVVCGGGKVCREYRDVAKGLGAGFDDLDFIGIMATHINAAALFAGLGKEAVLIRWKDLGLARKEVEEKFGERILVGGGYDVGSSSDYNAAVFAEAVEADLLINATNVDGVYTADPKIDPKARKLDRLSHAEFEKIILQNPQVPGEYRLFDLPATKLIKKARIKTIFIDGRDPEEIVRAVEGRHSGTVIG